MAFIGTDLGAAYGGMNDYSPQKPQLQQQMQQPEYQNDSQAAAAARRVSPPMSPVMSPSHPQSQPSPPTAIQLPPGQHDVFEQLRYENDVTQLQRELHKYQRNAAQPSFFDAMWAKRRELLKLLTMSLLVVIALSFHSVMEHVIKSYITENDLSSRNEVLLRFAYPLAMIMLVWFIKVGTSNK
jgi:uncharacterized membrane protein (DUF485 family)